MYTIAVWILVYILLTEDVHKIQHYFSCYFFCIVAVYLVLRMRRVFYIYCIVVNGINEMILECIYGEL